MRDSLAIVERALADYQSGHFGILDSGDLHRLVEEAREGRTLRIGCEAIVRTLDKMGLAVIEEEPA